MKGSRNDGKGREGKNRGREEMGVRAGGVCRQVRKEGSNEERKEGRGRN